MKTTSSTRITLPFSFFLLTLGVAACRSPSTKVEEADFFPSPPAVQFEACPTTAEDGGTVEDVFPDVQKVTIENRGAVGAPLNLALTGLDSALFSLGTVPPRLEALAQVEVPISFAPKKKGDWKAELVIDDATEGTPSQKVTLIGTGKNLPAQPSIETAPQMRDATGYLLCQEGSPLPDCTLEFPDTLYNQATTLKLKIRNTGCPALKIEGLSIESSRGDTQGFSIDSPAQLPSKDSPILLSTADGTEELTITVRFAPTNDNPDDTLRDASLLIVSNDKRFGDATRTPSRIALTALAVKPSIYTDPTRCDFSDPEDRCGYPTAQRPPDKARFRITNDGTTAVKLSKVTFQSTGGTTGTGGRFTISHDVLNETLTVGNSTTLEVTHSDLPVYVSDLIDIEATALLDGSPAGKATVAVYGGKRPCMTTEPLDQMFFMNAADELTAQPFKIRNGANCGTLVINSVSIDDSRFFSLIDPAIAPNVQIAPGGSAETTVQYKRPPSGGMQLATLRVQTNDADFGPPQYKLVQLYSQSPLDQVPVAVLTTCNPATAQSDPNCELGVTAGFTAQLSMLVRPELTLSGIKSTDDNQVKEYRFTLLPPFPGTVTSASLANHGMKLTTPTTKLTLGSGSGVYRVQLEVWDNRGQAGKHVGILNIYP